MKYLIGLTLCVLLVVEVSCKRTTSERPTKGPRTPRPTRGPRTPGPSRPTRGPPPDKCDSADDCQPGFCCHTHDAAQFEKGLCIPLAQDGQKCSLPERTMNGKYLHSCPCVEGLTCEAEKIKKIPFVGEIRVNERCANTKTTAQPQQDTTALDEQTTAPAEE